MKPIDLKDLTPKGSKFKLNRTGKEYRLRPFSLADENWLQQTFGQDVTMIFEKQDMASICRIAFHQLEEESKADFAVREYEIMNEEGETHKERLGGYKVLYAFIEGIHEKVALVYALVETIGISREMIDTITKDESQKSGIVATKPPEVKKKQRSTG